MYKFVVLLILIILVGFACREEPTEPAHGNLQLIAEDVGVTDAVIRLKVNVSHGPWMLTIIQDGNDTILREQMRYASVDTSYIFSNLKIKYTHTFKALYWIGGTQIDSSKLLYITTMDTTSHNFIFKIDTLGDGASSLLNDVVIINDSIIYAVGEIYKKDNNGQWELERYNIARWNGYNWNIMRATVQYVGYQGTPELEGIFAFSPTDIWLTGSYPIHGDGIGWTIYRLPDLGINASIYKVWGTSSSDIYFVGRNGAIVHFDGNAWRKINSGTTFNLKDIWGDINPKTGQYEIITVGYGDGVKSNIFNITSPGVMPLPGDGLSEILGGIWFKSGSVYYAVGYGIHRKRFIKETTPVWYRYGLGEISNYWSLAIRGSDVNDIVIGGERGELLHFNGISWHNYQTELGLDEGPIYAVDISGDLLVAVGFFPSDSGFKARAIIGRR